MHHHNPVTGASRLGRTRPHPAVPTTRLATGLLLAAGLALLGAMPAAFGNPSTTAYVEPALQQALAQRGQAKALVYLREQADLTPAFGMDWQTRGRFVYEQLTATAQRSQAQLGHHLQSRNADWQAFWIANVIVVHNADAALVEELRRLPEVRAIRAEPEIILIEPETVEPADAGLASRAVEANLSHVGAPQVWAQGYTGQGITIGVIDSGVRYTHQALVEQYRGNLGGSFSHDYHWWDPYDGTPAPFDTHGHGTHVTGTVVGDNGTDRQTGMAPGATWIACAGLPGGSGTVEGVLACGQFMLAPTDLAGNNADPERRPHAVNNSWGSCALEYNDFYEAAIDAWIAAGIVPVTSNGNNSNCGYGAPPGLNTVGNPARSGKVLGIGSTGNSNGQYATHSNWGPTDNPNPGGPLYPEHGGYPHLKPNVVAPGELILSAWVVDDTDDTYAWSTGTSMSSPHVAGLVALMWSAAPCLVGDYAATGTIIQQSARPVPYDSGGDPPPGYGGQPNYATGWGKIDAVAAVAEAQIRCGAHGRILGQVTSAATGEPIQGVTVTIANPGGQPAQFTAWTDANGQYSRTVAADTYTVNFTRDGGFGSASVPNVQVNDGGEQVVNVQLDAGYLDLPDTVSVQVVDGATASFSIDLNNIGTLASAVGLELLAGLREDFEGSFPPPGWATANTSGSHCGWTRNDQVTPPEQPIHPDHGGRPNYAGDQGYAAVADSDACGRGTFINAGLDTPPLDLSYTDSAELRFRFSYYHRADSRFGVQGSADGGQNWQPLTQWRSSVQPWGPGYDMAIDLADYLGQQDVRLRFEYQGDWNWWAQVDQVRVVMQALWAELSALHVVIPGQGTGGPMLHIDSGLLPGPGTYRLTLIVEHDNPEQPSPMYITVIVTVIAGQDAVFSDNFEVQQ